MKMSGQLPTTVEPDDLPATGLYPEAAEPKPHPRTLFL
jgi:hypothetical protein